MLQAHHRFDDIVTLEPFSDNGSPRGVRVDEADGARSGAALRVGFDHEQLRMLTAVQLALSRTIAGPVARVGPAAVIDGRVLGHSLRGRCIVSAAEHRAAVPLGRVSRTLARRHGEGHAGALPVEAARHLLDAVVALDGSWPDAYPLSLADQLAVGFDGDVWCTLQLERLTGRTTLGSAVWLSPEHLRGAPRDAAARVYEVAVRLYRLLAGQPPFSAPDAEPGRETTALISAALQPARVPLRTARPDIDDAVAAVLDAAVHVEPARRPSLLALRDALPSSPRSAELWASLLNELFPAEAEEAARFWEEAALAQLDGGVRREPVEVIAPSHDAVGDTQHLLEVQLTRT